MSAVSPERGEEPPEHDDHEPTATQLHGEFDDPEDLDMEELEDDDGWGEDDE